MAQKIQQTDDDDSSKDTTTAEEVGDAGPINQTDSSYASYLTIGRPKGKGKAMNREARGLSRAPLACSINIGVCGRLLWADPKTNMILCTWNSVLCLVACLCLLKYLSIVTYSDKGPPQPP